eukprot:CAMPEP_0116066224 /NCGR_PEP_ID=MMETSP0322-20121206/10254_1 /TAXON_ID=163516 /ORGANISM="Leptocylindrus danicus var. apora, Strain B651" /LENGTH=505 /DNA_ID=CAMNT_0003552735 /DNA_START=209 /DNA_END=1726 /DNA_ORIENTATION=-
MGNSASKKKGRQTNGRNTAPTQAVAANKKKGDKSSRSDVQPVVLESFEDVRIKYHVSPKELGNGHYGVVRQCQNRETKEWFAVKTIKKSKVNRVDILKREVGLLREVKHPNIIELVDMYEDEKFLHLVTELCTGGELFDRIVEKTKESDDSNLSCFSEHDAAKLICKILDAIAYCHDEKGIVHRDLKPENFLFKDKSDDSEIKIIDFGLSRHDDENAGVMNTKVGTPYYVAPEVLKRRYTKACDLWSIGVIAYILLCGYPPFYGDSDNEIFKSIRDARFDFPDPEWTSISDLAKDFIINLLQKDPTKRMTAKAAMKHEWIVGKLSKTRITHNTRRSITYKSREGTKKLRKAVVAFIGSRLTKAEISQIGKVFESIDKDGNGELTLNEINEALSSGSLPVDVVEGVRELRTQILLADIDNQTVNWKGFLNSVIERNISMREAAVKEVFSVYDRSKTNVLRLSDLIQLLGSEKLAKEVMGDIDLDRDGVISFDEFKTAVLNSSIPLA